MQKATLFFVQPTPWIAALFFPKNGRGGHLGNLDLRYRFFGLFVGEGCATVLRITGGVLLLLLRVTGGGVLLSTRGRP